MSEIEEKKKEEINQDINQRLLNERIIFLSSEVNDQSANKIVAELLLLSSIDDKKDIYLYINSPGGSITAGMAIYDTMKFINNDVVTVGIGLAASMGQFLLSAGTKGKRFALENTRIMMHQPSGGIGGTAADIIIQAEQMLFIKKRMAELIAKFTNQKIEKITEDSDRDSWFTSSEAVEYGFIDKVISNIQELKVEKSKKEKKNV